MPHTPPTHTHTHTHTHVCTCTHTQTHIQSASERGRDTLYSVVVKRHIHGTAGRLIHRWPPAPSTVQVLAQAVTTLCTGTSRSMPYTTNTCMCRCTWKRICLVEVMETVEMTRPTPDDGPPMFLSHYNCLHETKPSPTRAPAHQWATSNTKPPHRC